MQPLSPHALANTEVFHNSRYRVVLDEGVAYQDLFRPQFWAAHKQRLVRFDIVRVVAADESFDVDLTVSIITELGVVMRLKDRRPSREDARGTTAHPEVRIEYLPATDWRLMGIGNVEIKRGMTKPEADEALANYLEQAGLKHDLLVHE